MNRQITLYGLLLEMTACDLNLPDVVRDDAGNGSNVGTGGAGSGGGTGSAATGSAGANGGATSAGGGTGVCNPGSKQCEGLVLQTCNDSGAWELGTECSGATPVCSGGQCVAPLRGASCTGLANTCGPNLSEDCCASRLIPGGTFNRSNQADYPATVSDFWMDSYEVTVGRFRKLVEAGRGTQEDPPAQGTGANPNVSGSGWQSEWNDELRTDATSLKAGLTCDSIPTWTDTPAGNENRPINCVSWYEAFAFCIWDSGRLATEAEWNYAAAGGSEQREYPWPSPNPTGSDGCDWVSYGCKYECNALMDGQCNLTDITPVGTKPAGNGKWGQADLAGNVWEWVLDWVANPYPTPCNNCANLMPPSDPDRAFRGGSFRSDGSEIRNATRGRNLPSSRFDILGFRCVRIP